MIPAVPVKKSVTPDHIISLEDGRPYKSLKRHLKGRGMTPADYRAKWGLAADYPMVAPNYAKARSELARSFGLGRRPTVAPAAVPAPTAVKGRGRKKAESAEPIRTSTSAPRVRKRGDRAGDAD